MLLLAQQGALLHELSHAYYTAQALGPQASPGGQLSDSAQCVTCQTFAQLAHAASGSAPTPAVPWASALCIAPPLATAPGTRAFAPRSRGPPPIRV